MAADRSYVQYFIPGDGDSEEHPNVFLVRKATKDLRLADVQQASRRCGLASQTRGAGMRDRTPAGSHFGMTCDWLSS